jgi:simple sugar transport system ATP-binding protein
VEILKALYRGADVLILDEPTAVLTPQESFALFDTLRALAAQGKTIVFISHKLKEVLAVSRWVTVMRAGKVTGELETARTDQRELARLMVGRDVMLRVDKVAATPGEVVLELQGVDAEDDRRLPALRDVNLQVRAGTVLGIAGVEGNGQTELIEVITGLRAPTAGRLTLSGEDITGRSPRGLRDAGLAHIPEDRLERGISVEASVEENLILDTFHRPPLSRRGWLDRRAIRAYAKQLIADYEIATPDAETRAGSLSGGNMQKIVVAREIAGRPPLLIAAQPTRGVDVGAIEYIHRRIIELRDRGSAVLLVSAELDEILSLSDEVAVLYEGRIVSVQPRSEVDELELGLRMAGAHHDGPVAA